MGDARGADGAAEGVAGAAATRTDPGVLMGTGGRGGRRAVTTLSGTSGTTPRSGSCASRYRLHSDAQTGGRAVGDIPSERGCQEA